MVADRRGSSIGGGITTLRLSVSRLRCYRAGSVAAGTYSLKFLGHRAMAHRRENAKMSQHQIARLRAYVENGAVVLASDDPNLRQGSDGNWTFTIVKGSPAEVVFELYASDKQDARSALRQVGRDQSLQIPGLRTLAGV